MPNRSPNRPQQESATACRDGDEDYPRGWNRWTEPALPPQPIQTAERLALLRSLREKRDGPHEDQTRMEFGAHEDPGHEDTFKLMGKRELLLIVAFVFFGAVVYQVAAPALVGSARPSVLTDARPSPPRGPVEQRRGVLQRNCDRAQQGRHGAPCRRDRGNKDRRGRRATTLAPSCGSIRPAATRRRHATWRAARLCRSTRQAASWPSPSTIRLKGVSGEILR